MVFQILTEKDLYSIALDKNQIRLGLHGEHVTQDERCGIELSCDIGADELVNYDINISSN